jgi:hypothetical protein
VHLSVFISVRMSLFSNFNSDIIQTVAFRLFLKPWISLCIFRLICLCSSLVFSRNATVVAQQNLFYTNSSLLRSILQLITAETTAEITAKLAFNLAILLRENLAKG